MSFSELPAAASSASIKPFTISTPQETLVEMKTLIKLSKIAPLTYESATADTKSLDGFGIRRDWLVNARDEWLKFDWRKTEEHLNSFPHFIAQIESEGANFDVHFVGMFSQKEDAAPVIFLHGWPGDFLEFIPTLSLLREKYTPSTLPFHVIVPSLPGYAFSSGPPLDRDFSTLEVAAIMDKLMHQLGFGGGYIAQGGDIGSRVARLLGKDHSSCKAIHVNYLNISEPAQTPERSSLPEFEQKGVERGEQFGQKGFAYGMEHGTRPSTIGFVLQSNPIALLSWIGEKFIGWTDETPKLETILESVTLYWITETIARCLYPYRHRPPTSNNTTTPIGFSSFAKELAPTPESWARTEGNLVFYRYHEKGGHFAALEQPETLLQDVTDFVAKVWKK